MQPAQTTISRGARGGESGGGQDLPKLSKQQSAAVPRTQKSHRLGLPPPPKQDQAETNRQMRGRPIHLLRRVRNLVMSGARMELEELGIIVS